ncbi:HAD hydrolase family protein [Epilithonimonas sp. UC225_85]
MSFVDYMNDMVMLQKSKYSYAMENAHQSVCDQKLKELSKNNSCFLS